MARRLSFVIARKKILGMHRHNIRIVILFKECQQIVRDEGGTIVPFFKDYVEAASDKIQYDAPLSGLWETDAHRAAERWWFA